MALTALTQVPPKLSGLYVDGFIDPLDSGATILGVADNEDDLLAFCQAHGINYLLLYNLSNMAWGTSGAGSLTVPGCAMLAAFIKKARTLYGIVEVAAVRSGSGSSVTETVTYNAGRSDSNEKFTAYNIEMEWWNYPNAGTVTFATLKSNLIAAYSNCVAAGLVCEIYTGWYGGVSMTAVGSGYTAATVAFTGGGGSGAAGTCVIDTGKVTRINMSSYGSGYTSAPTVTISGNGTGATASAFVSGGQIRNEFWQIAPYVHRILVHMYVTDPSNAFNYGKDRMKQLGLNRLTKILPLFSAEDTSDGNNFMGAWYATPHTNLEDWEEFRNDYNAETDATIKNYAEVIGKVVFAQSQLRDKSPKPLALASSSTGSLDAVEWSTVTLTKKGSRNIKAVWVVTEQHDNLKFVLEKSANQSTWQSVGNIAGYGAGDDVSTKSYTLTDHLPTKGTTYYRIKQISTTGSVSYSPVKSIVF